MQHTISDTGYVVDDDPLRLDIDFIHGFLSEVSYWAKGIPREVVEKSVRGSLCFGLYKEGRQVGFARMITDRATFGYLADVFIIPGHRGQGLSKDLLRVIMEHPDLQGLRRILLSTSDAHGLYRQFGFTGIDHPDKLMQYHRPQVYSGK